MTVLRMEKNRLAVQLEQSEWRAAGERERPRSGGPWGHAKGCGFSLHEMKTHRRVLSAAMDFNLIIPEAGLRRGYRGPDGSRETC